MNSPQSQGSACGLFLPLGGVSQGYQVSDSTGDCRIQGFKKTPSVAGGVVFKRIVVDSLMLSGGS